MVAGSEGSEGSEGSWPRVEVLEERERAVVGGSGGVEGLLAGFFFLDLLFFFLPRGFFGVWVTRATGRFPWGASPSFLLLGS
jgi:hypothetical protein